MSVRDILALACATAFLSSAAFAADTIKIGFPIPLSGPTAVYGEPILKGAEMAVAEINAKGGVLGRKLELLSRDSKANADEAVRLARELIIKDNVDFLAGTLTSAEAPAVSTIAKENKIVFVAPTAKTHEADRSGKPPPLYLPRRLEHRCRGQGRGDPDGAQWKDVKTRRDDRPRLCLWPRRDRRLHRRPEEAAPRHRRSSISNGRNSAKPISPLHHRADGQKARRGLLRSCSAAISSPSPSRRRRSAISRRSTTGSSMAAEVGDDRRSPGARQRLSLRHRRRRLRPGDLDR